MFYIMACKYFLTEYVFSAIEDDRVCCIQDNQLHKCKNRVWTYLLKIEAFLPFSFFAKKIFSHKMNEVLENINIDEKILIWDIQYAVPIAIAVAIGKIVKSRIKYLWIWNALNPKGASWRIKLLKKYYTIFTFDNKNAVEYGINYKDQVYCLKKINNTDCIKYDFYFIGYDKNRSFILNELQKRLNGYICNFIILKKIVKAQSYEKNLENVISSRCLVDIVKEGQSGLTMRVLEAAVYQKKLITNNRTILDTDLYNKNNVFILDYDNLDDIDDFMKREIVPVSEAVLQKYDINHWIKEFLD